MRYAREVFEALGGAEEACALIERLAPGLGWAFRDVARLGPACLEGFGTFEIVETRGVAERLYLAVRAGTPRLEDEDVTRLLALPDAGSRNKFEVAALNLHALPPHPLSTLLRASALFGEVVCDVLCLPLDLAGTPPRLMAAAGVLGAPQEPFGDAVRVRRDVRAWLRAAGGGVVLLGTWAENVRWLRGCGEVICDDLAQAEALRIKLARDYDTPKLMVAG